MALVISSNLRVNVLDGDNIRVLYSIDPGFKSQLTDRILWLKDFPWFYSVPANAGIPVLPRSTRCRFPLPFNSIIPIYNSFISC
jgi:hypothetical protein